MKKPLLLLLLLTFLTLVVYTQNVGIGTASPLARLHVADSSILFTAQSPLALSPGVVPISGEGNRLMWYAYKAAFRTGGVGNVTFLGNGRTFWDTDSIGNYSFAAGFNCKAKGEYSTALGVNVHATGARSTALGSFLIASGDKATAMGYYTVASGGESTAMGSRSTASGFGSTAMGTITNASGLLSTAMGFETNATGNVSTALGEYTTAKAFASVAIGKFNDTIVSSSATSWEAADPLFYIGNGTAYNATSNAMIVYKNGDTEIGGYTQLGKIAVGAPSIKMKILKNSTAALLNTWVNVPHGLDYNKIIAVNVILKIPGFVNLPPSYTFHSGYQYDYQVSPANIVILNVNGNSANILSKEFTILVTYVE